MLAIKRSASDSEQVIFCRRSVVAFVLVYGGILLYLLVLLGRKQEILDSAVKCHCDCDINMKTTVDLHNSKSREEQLKELERSLTPSPRELALDQDQPELWEYLRAHVLIPPPPMRKKELVALRDVPGPADPHKKLAVQREIYKVVRDALQNKSSGFYIECGANDGLTYSNTFPFEIDFNWSGLLIEPDPKPLEKLKALGRSAWISPTCLSTKTTPTTAEISRGPGDDALMSSSVRKTKGETPFVATCVPLYALLSAINVTTVDYFSLDIEGAELGVLKTIPWDKLNVTVLSVEVSPVDGRKGGGSLHAFILSKGYKLVRYVENLYSHDNVYVKKV